MKNTTCLENGEWSEIPHNNELRFYCQNEEHEAVREKIAYLISVFSAVIIFSVISGFCCACVARRARRKKKIRQSQLVRQNQVMFDNQAYLEDSRRFQEVGGVGGNDEGNSAGNRPGNRTENGNRNREVER